MENKYCNKCGAPLSMDDMFCFKCGMQLDLEGHANFSDDSSFEKMTNKSVQTLSSEISFQQTKMPKKIKWRIIILCALITILIVFSLKLLLKNEANDEKYIYNQTTDHTDVSSPIIPEDNVALPELTEFETLMTNAVIDFYDAVGIDAVAKGYLLKKYEVSDISGTEAVYEHMITCTYGPNKTIGLNGTANDGKVEYVFTFIPLIGMNVDADTLSAMAPMAMIPAGLYEDKYSNVEGLYDLLEKLVQTGTRDEEGDTTTLVIDDIEYSLTVSNSMLSFSVNAREKSSIPNTTLENRQNNDNNDVTYGYALNDIPMNTSVILSDYIGKTVSDVRNSFGNDFSFEGYEGTSIMPYYDKGITFFLEKYSITPSNSDRVIAVTSNDEIKIFEKLSGNMSYSEIVKAIGSEVTLEQPIKYFDEHDGREEYNLQFDYKGYDVSFIWFDDPDINKSSYVRASK